MRIKIGVIMDPIEHIHIEKDTTFALLLEAQKRHWEIYYTQTADLFLDHNTVYGAVRKIQVQDHIENFVRFENTTPTSVPLTQFDMVLMRKDPPFDIPYLYATYLLELAQKAGCYIVNNPTSMRDANEKLFTTHFPQCCPPTLVTSQKTNIQDFLTEHKKIILKPLHSMGGQSIFLLTQENPNIHVTVEMLTHGGKYPIMAQRYLPEIIHGDKRIIMIDGKAYPYGLARIPQPGDIRANLAAGGKGIGYKLSAHDYWIAEQVGPTLKEKGLSLVGLDVIGDYLTEINVTSPTCVREIERAFDLNICTIILDSLWDAKQRLKSLPK